MDVIKKYFLLLIFVLFEACVPIYQKINKQYVNQYAEESFPDSWSNCIKVSRQKLFENLIDKNISNGRIYVVEIYNINTQSLYASIKSSSTNLYFKRKNYDACDKIQEFIPSENFQTQIFKFIYEKAKIEDFHSLTNGASKKPISNSGLVYLTILDISKPSNKFKFVKTICFEEFGVD